MFSNNCKNESQDTYDNQPDITFESQNQSAIMSAPPYIYPITPGVAPITYIPNYQYFIINPIHGPNSGADCGPIAAQILLSYHNYYSDRRIIDNGFLFNGEDNPNECTNPMLMTSGTLGSRDIYFEHIRDNTTMYSEEQQI